MDRHEMRLMILWAVLMLITLMSWESSSRGVLHNPVLLTASVLVLAFVKVRIVILDFMEVRHAPVAMRIALEAWGVIACGSIIALLFHASA